MPPLRRGRRRVGTANSPSGPCDHTAVSPESPSEPRIECSTGPFWAFELERAFDAIAEAGFTEVEVMVTRDPKTQDPDIPLRLAKERDLRIMSVHGPFLMITKNVWGADPIRKVQRGVEMCEALGAQTLIVHPPYLWERDYARWLQHESGPYSARTGVTVAVETMYPKWVAGRRLRAHRWLDPQELFDAVPHIVIDTSHVTMARKDILQSLAILAPKLVHVHLSNNAGDGRDGHLELEKGILPIDRFLSDLRRIPFVGTVSLEISVIRYLERPQELAKMLSKNREYVQTKLSRDNRVEKGLPRR